MKEERIEIIVGNPQDPVLHIKSTVGKLRESLDLMYKPPPITIPTRRFEVIEEPTEIQHIKHEYQRNRNRANDEYNEKIFEINFQEKLEISKFKKRLGDK